MPVSERWFLKVDGITGESTDAAHKGEIDVDAWSWGVANSAGGGSGGGAGRAQFDDFQFVSRISSASPPLLSACATGTHIKQATLSGVRGAGAGAGKAKSGAFLKYQLSDVTVASVQQADTETTVPTEQFSLRYAKVEVTYTPTTSSGKMGVPVTFGYDVKANKKI